jgi:rRNA biogenesis protein RRP5
MSSLKRKEAPGGTSTAKPKDSRPPKRSKPEKPAKGEGQISAKEGKPAGPPKGEFNVVSRLKDDDKLFPRGGGSVLSPLEQKQIQLQARNDVLFEQESTPTTKKSDKILKKKKKRKSTGKVEDTLGKLTRDEDAVKIEPLSFKVNTPVN